MATNLTTPLKVTLPPWRRGDNTKSWEHGWYAVRKVGDRYFFFEELLFSETFHAIYDYAGPIEFIETPPEPEPLTLAGHAVLVREGKYGNHHEVSMWPTVDSDCEVRLIVADKEVKTAIEKFNAAVRAMEGKHVD